MYPLHACLPGWDSYDVRVFHACFPGWHLYDLHDRHVFVESDMLDMRDLDHVVQ